MEPLRVKPMAPLDVPGLLRRYGLRPKKSLGQNFLIDESALARIAAAADLAASDTVLEIAPGLASLTRHLAHASRRVVAVEIDGNLIPILQQVLAGEGNGSVVHADILHLNPVQLMDAEAYLVVANIPYYITSAILRHLLDSTHRPLRLALTVQREVADRICAVPGDMSLLALSVQVYGVPRPVLRIPAGAFYPPPNVDSSTLRVDLYPQPRLPAAQLDPFFRLAKAGFSQKRKTLRNALSGGLGWKPDQGAQILQAAGIDPQRRAETLTTAEWAGLT